ncbi:MAG: hypothetical protein US65_C0053G0007 [Candidatus Yanofskybacteria bacterium GW2011_GWC2_37_9]|uniref:Uncharacterized protein n=1 Tax=Candidatus Yanofskybacteria bacterium GW2011_GWC2_37_9 TaxID=1619028 RepID=A0A0G0KY37_9BACT|nr:MAG: hypothetical protein US65_C0053G0007 [Candidatus Yanofskybacteria bacterium GW2011_GWC2_37_9]
MKFRNKKSGATREGTPECHHIAIIANPKTMSSANIHNTINVKIKNQNGK